MSCGFSSHGELPCGGAGQEAQPYRFLGEAGSLIFLKIIYLFIYLFVERGREGEERERHINVWLPLMRPLLGTWPETQARALTGN